MQPQPFAIFVKPVTQARPFANQCLVCDIDGFFTRRDLRGQGVSVGLLRAAVEHVRRRKGKIVEGYPIEPKGGSLPAPFVYTGLASAFRAAGFKEVARRSATRPIFRYVIEAQ